MRSSKKLMALALSTIMSASTFAGLGISASAQGGQAVLTPIVSEATSAVVIKAAYDENGRLTGVTIDNEGIEVVPGQNVVIDNVEPGVKVMLWDAVDGMIPLTNAAVAAEVTEAPTQTPTTAPTQTPTETPTQTPTTAPTQTPTEAPTQTPTTAPTQTPTEAPTQTPTTAPTEAPLPEGVYVFEDFDSYADGEIVKSAGNDVDEAYAPVTKGKITYAAGRRTNGLVNTSASIAGQALKIDSDGYCTSGRGVSFSFTEDAGIPKVSEIEDGKQLEMSMDVTAAQAFTIKGLGDVTLADLTTSSTVKLRAILDKSANTQSIIVTDAEGNVLSSKTAALTAETFTGAEFYKGAGVITIDNIKVEKKDKDTAAVNVVLTNGETAIDGATIKIGKLTRTTDAEGKVSVVVPNGKYTLTAEKAGYIFSADSNIDTKEATVAGTDIQVDMFLKVLEYVALPETVAVLGGQDFIAAPKTEDYAETAAFTLDVKDQYGIDLPSDKYSTTWNIYPSGTTNADPNVTIENGVVKVSKAFTTSKNIAVYDIVAAAFTDDRNQKVTKTIYIGNNDMIYYEPFNWTQGGGTGNRGGEQKFVNAIEMSDMMAVDMNVNFTSGTDGQVTAALMSDAGALVGLQYASDGNVKAWTGWTGNSAFNQSGDVGKFTNGEVLVTGYEKGTPLDVKFTIDKVNKSVTVMCNGTTVSLPYTVEATKLTSVKFGQYRNYGAIAIKDIAVQEPDANYLSIAGATEFAKVAGTTVTRNYGLGQSVIVPGESFEWTVVNEAGVAVEGVSIADGVLSVTAAAVPGKYTVKATSSTNAEKTASLNVEIADFQQLAQAEVTGARAYNTGAEGDTYAVTLAKDQFGDDILAELRDIKWTSSNTEVAEIDEATGKLTVKGAGTTTVKATVTNGTAVTEKTVEVTVSTYALTGDATGASTNVDTSALVKGAAIAKYLVTTADADGNAVKSEEVDAAAITAGSYTVDTTGAAKYEIAPVYSYQIGNPGTLGVYGEGFEIAAPADTYNFVVNVTGSRCDVYANKQMLVNNILQGGSAVTSLEVNDIVVDDGVVKITTADYANGQTAAGSNVSIKMVKSPSIVNRVKKVYVLGDSLACIYYNGADATKNYQTGWGQVLDNYLKGVEVVDLANSGATANGLYNSAFSQVATSAKEGDLLVLESGYNDKTYDPEAVMLNAVTSMVNQSKEKGVDVVLVSPNASKHDYKADVAWTQKMAAAAEATNTDYIDLSKLSYEFLYGLYGDDFTGSVVENYNVSDKLHSTYNGAHKWASIVAKELAGLGYADIVDTDYSYTFTDAKGAEITCSAK